MAIQKILIYPEHKDELRRKSEPVSQVNKRVRRMVRDLKETLQAHGDGIGLAAPQINIHQRLVIVCVGDDQEGEWVAGPPRALINPQIVLEEDEREDFDGCLSFPGLYGETVRPHRLQVTGLDEGGRPFDELFTGFNAVVVHHEIDHLNGVLFIDRIKSMDDLYTVRKNAKGELVRVPIGTNLSNWTRSRER